MDGEGQQLSTYMYIFLNHTHDIIASYVENGLFEDTTKSERGDPRERSLQSELINTSARSLVTS